jgi:hypothetical protein
VYYNIPPRWVFSDADVGMYELSRWTTCFLIGAKLPVISIILFNFGYADSIYIYIYGRNCSQCNYGIFTLFKISVCFYSVQR